MEQLYEEYEKAHKENLQNFTPTVIYTMIRVRWNVKIIDRDS